MARVKIDWTKVELDSTGIDAAKILESAPNGIKTVVEAGNVKGKVSKVAITVGEGESAKMYGGAFLKLSDAKPEAYDAILAEIKNAGADAIVNAYNDYQRNLKLESLQANFGDVTAAIDEAVKVLVANGFAQDEAREMVIAKRKAAGKRV